MVKHYLKRSRGTMTLIGVLVVGVVIGGGAVLTLMRGGAANLISTVQAQEPEAEQGVLISGVVADSAAAEAGLVRGDILLQVDDQAVNSVLELQRVLTKLTPDTNVTLIVLHGDDEKTLATTLGERDGQPYLGVIPCAAPHIGNYTRRFGSRLKPGFGAMAGEKQTVAIKVIPDGPAAKAGLKQGDIIMMVDEQAVDVENSLTDIMGRYAPGEVVTIELERDGNSQSITVTLGEHPDQSDKAFLGIAYGVEIEIDQQLDLEQNGDTESFHFFHHLPGQAIPLLDLSTGAEAQEGVIVHQVADDSPAIGSGLEVGQIITAVDGEAVSEPGALAEIIANHAPGETLTLTVTAKDDDASQEVTVTLGEDSVQAGQAYLGVQLGHFFRIKQTGSGLDEEAMVLEWTGQISRVVESHFGDSDKIELMFDGSPLNLLPDMDFLLEHDLPALWFTDGSL